MGDVRALVGQLYEVETLSSLEIFKALKLLGLCKVFYIQEVVSPLAF